MKRSKICLLAFVAFLPFLAFAEGSKNLTPSFGTGDGTTNNNFIGYLIHTQGDGNAGITGPFLSPSASADERLNVYIRQGETLYMGFRRIVESFGTGRTFGDLNVILRQADGTFVTSFLILANTASTGVNDDWEFQTSQAGVIESYAEALVGPASVVGASGYNDLSWTNTSLGDQAFYIEVVQSTAGSGVVTSEADANAIFIESRYDLWDVSVYDGSTEKPGRLFCKAWGFTASSFTNQFSDDFQLFVRIPSTIGGSTVGNYIKEVDFAGIQPFTTLIFANETGADIGSTTDLNGDGVTDFQDARRTQTGNIGGLGYDIFISNPDIELYPTTILPTISITDASVYCNVAGTGGEAVINFSVNQSGIVAILIDLNGVTGFQDGTTDVVIEQEVDASSGSGVASVRWDGIDGLGGTVVSGTSISITGRFTAGPVHTPLFDPEINSIGINMTDVRPASSFDLIYWDDRSATGVGSPVGVELSGTNSAQHTWTDGDGLLVNTWSFGYYQVNSQNLTFSYICDSDGDGINNGDDLDSDNDGITDAVEGDFLNDTDADNIPDFLDVDFAGYVDSNGDGINDNFDADLDGIVDALDVDSDNDGIPDVVENGQSDTDRNGQIDSFIDVSLDGLDDNLQGATITNNLSFSDDCQEADAPTHTITFSVSTADANADVDFIFDIQGDYGPQANEDFTATIDGTGLGTFDPGGADCALNTNFTVTIPQATWNTANDDGSVTIILQAGSGVNDNVGGCNDADGDGIEDGSCIFNPTLSYTIINPTPGASLTLIDTDGDGVNNHLDLDSDDDGIVDVIEAGGTADATTGRIASFTDTDNNGFNDSQQFVALSLTDSDSDGSLPDYLDIDSDNDGILDNVESQLSSTYIAIAAGDTDGNGLLDVYDPNNGGTFITPIDTDSNGTEDYQDADADGDGVEDRIEGWDADFDGFNDLEAVTNDNDLSDETGFNVDTDSDGLWDIFESSTAPIQNTDGADEADWQDTDDDNDGNLTSGEDANSNGDWTDDKTQGQGGSATVPDYLYRGDYDGDAIADSADADSDNDGITDATESNGQAVDPSGDNDADGIANYRDTDDPAVTSLIDSNGDFVYDEYDSDLDGIPDFLDLDSDNDGIWDAVEADEGSVPFGLDETLGQFTLNDPDNDGLMNFVDTDDVSALNPTSDLANPDTDADGVRDYIDIDSDGDGIPDNIEAQTSAAYIAPANSDADGDGIDDSYDPSSGGTKLDPVNSEGLDVQDYLDTDSDNDGIADVIEGDDMDSDGFGDWDSDSDNDITDEAAYLTDSDGDGLPDIFDTVAKGSAGNESGSNADRQNTDGIDFRDWRDSNDDNDAALTADEDVNGNNDFTDDRNQGQVMSGPPDYLFNGDFDLDLIADTPDTDSDNDGLPDVDEDGGESINPSGDEDGDGIPNFRDQDDATVTSGLSSIADSNGDGVYDVFDADLDGLPDFRDRDSDDDGIPDLVEAGGVDSDGDGAVDGLTDSDNDGIPNSVDISSTGGFDTDNDGIDDAFDFSVSGGTDTDGDDIIDSADLDRDGDGLVNTYDTDPDDNAVVTTTLANPDTDGDGVNNVFDNDSDNDGIPDIIEAGGTDSDGNGKVDDNTDTDGDGLADATDSSNGGTAYTIPDTDNDNVRDYLDVDSDNDGITDTVENGGADANSDGRSDTFVDSNGNGYDDTLDPDSGGTPIANVDSDGDGLSDYRDLDADNDAYPDILEGGGTESDGDGIVDNWANADLLTDLDNVPDNVDVDNSGANGGSGTDTDGDEIDNSFDVDQTGGTDTDGDGIDDNFDTDADGDGLDDAVEATPYIIEDEDGDGNKDFRDLDSDGDGISDVVEFGQTADASTAQINGFTDANSNGWNDTQESTPFSPVNSDTDSFNDYQDIDADNDGIPDNIEAHTKLTYINISGVDSDNDGLDDAYDPNNGGTIVPVPNTDGTGSADFLDTDSDGDNVPDNIEGDNDDRSQYADWDTNNNNDVSDETGATADTDNDGLLDVYDNNSGVGAANIIGSNSNGQDSDSDGIWDFQDNDDDGDGLLTSSQGLGNEDSDSDGDPTDDFDDDTENIIPNYLFGSNDNDVDGVADATDLDSDNDGLADTSEDGGTGIDPSGDIDGDNVPNAFDEDIDGDAILNTADLDADGNSSADTFTLTDDNADGIADEFDKDQDAVPDYLDIDSDNDGIVDVLEYGLTDTDQDGTLAESGAITDANNNGIDDSVDAACGPVSGNAVAQNGAGTNPDNALGNNSGTFAQVTSGQALDLDMGVTVPSGNTIALSLSDGFGAVNATANIFQSADDVTYTNSQLYTATTATGVPETFNYVLTADTRWIRVQEENGTDRPVNIYLLSYSFTACPSATAVTPADTDSDGVSNHLDLDSDNDGLPDNIEAQTTAGYIAPVVGDTDADGLFNVYDPDNSGTYITPTQTNSSDDYLVQDSDGDGVNDIIEAFDTNSNGFGDWDTDGDNDITDETGWNVDDDNDGLFLIFDNSAGLGSVANITGSNASRQDTDGDTAEDWRDTNDDGDSNLTSAEDGGNSIFTDDFTQGGGSTPDYLFNPDVDGDGVEDALDGDSDNDGVLNSDEYAGTTYAVGSDVSGNAGTPFGDSDGDGIFNYLDASDVNFTITDVNSDGVDDRVDQDRDGVPNFFDLDADNDGVLDGIEANDGAVPTNFSTTTGTFSTGDSDNDGIDNQIDTSTGGTALPKGNQDSADGDSLDDYLDLDSDNDGLTDNVESQAMSSFIIPTATDADGDGLLDVYDANNGGTALIPINTDGTDEPDFRDTDSDNDRINPVLGELFDVIEGFDANRNGFSDLDTDLDGLLTDESGYNVDTDGDGLWDLFDSFSGRGVNNIQGSSADLQDTDSDGSIDFRDTDDDSDAITTSSEDVGDGSGGAPDGIWTNDKTQGGGATPDYLFFNDSDNDRVADGQDADGDNDGILDSNEYDATVYRNPFGDIDNDGVFNYNDTDNPNALDGTTPLTDSNSDGVWDEYDTDLDGVPDFFDLDSDNDGIPDIVEAGGTDSDNDGILDGLTDSDDDGIPDNVDVNSTGGVDANSDGIDDSFQDGTDTDGDGIEDTADLDVDGDGIVSAIDTSEGGTALPNEDFDGDGLENRVDLDSDSDGILDLIEAGGSDTDGDGRLDSSGDTDGDGLGNIVDLDNGGTALALPNTDGTDDRDYLDRDADADGVFDFNEGFDDDEDGSFTDDYTARATAYGNASQYSPLDLAWYNNDDDGDNLPNFLDPQSGRFLDTDSDGIIDLFDVNAGGDFYGNVNRKPDNDSDGTENYIDLDGDFTVSVSNITTGEDGTNATFDVVLTLQPTTNVVINISETSDEISLSNTTLTFTNGNWNMTQTVTVFGEDDLLNDGSIPYDITLSVSDALSDDNFDSASDKVVSGVNNDNEGSIVVSTNSITTGEDGTNGSFDVQLSVSPAVSQQVVIDITESSDEGSISAVQLTFDDSNWNNPQTVNITAADDSDLDGDQSYNITLSVNDPLSDDNFDAASDQVIAVTNVDDEQGVILNTTSIVTSESGTTADFTVVLDVAPSSNVQINLSEASDEGSLSTSTLTFLPGNFSTPQTVTVTPADDADADGNQIYQITVSVDGSSDAVFLSVADQSVTVTNQDNETVSLPLDFLSFEGEVIDTGISLEWVTVNEENVESIILQKSDNGHEFQDIYQTSGTNIKSARNIYGHLDGSPFVGLNYYRIKQVDFDDEFMYSDVISVLWEVEAFSITAYPNPVDRMLNLRTNVNIHGLIYEIMDVQGRILLKGDIDQFGSEANMDLSNLQRGVYFLRLSIPESPKLIRIIKD